MEKLIDRYELQSCNGTYTCSVYAELVSGRVYYRSVREFEPKAELFNNENERLNASRLDDFDFDSFDKMVKWVSAKSRIRREGMTEADIVEKLLPCEESRRQEQWLQYRAWQTWDSFDDDLRKKVYFERKRGHNFVSAVMLVRSLYAK